MDFIDKIRDLSARIPAQLEHIQTEEATKNALIMPFISALGYNVFDPMEVTPELHADVPKKKGEKVDYAILREGKPIMLFECKWHGYDLNNAHMKQLHSYFHNTEARFGVLTNGIIYRFFTDLEKPNIMDSSSFFEFNMLDIREQDVEELKKFTKSIFDIDGIVSTASDLKYTREIKRIMAEELQQPSDNFVRFFASQVYSGRMTQSVIECFTPTVQRALKQFINERVNERLKTALDTDISSTESAQISADTTSEAVETPEKPSVITTTEELEGYHIVKAILREVVDVNRIVMRDVQSYCGILLDDKNNKPICRLWFNSKKKHIGFFDNEQKKEEKVLIENLDEIYKYADRLKVTITFYAK